MKELTDHQWEIMQLIAQGYSNKEMADIFKCSTKTIEKHREAIYYKWRVNCALALVRVGLRSGAIALETFLGSDIGENRHHAIPQPLERIKP